MVTREALRHHVEALFRAHFPGEGIRRRAPGVQEFINKAIEEIQEARVLQGDHFLPGGVAHCPGEGKDFRVSIDIPGLIRVASWQLFWLSRVGRCEGPPHSYVRMPFGLPGAAMVFQRCTRDALAAREARHQAILMEMAIDPREPHGPPEPPEVQDQDGS